MCAAQRRTKCTTQIATAFDQLLHAWPTATELVKGLCNCDAVSYVVKTEKVVFNIYYYCKDC